MTQKEELIKQLTFMIKTIPEQLFRIVFDAFQLFIISSLMFGKRSKPAKESKNVMKEMSRILKEEKHLLKQILKNIDFINLDDTCDVVDTLDDLNDKTYRSYDGILSQVEVSIDTKNPNRILRPNKIDSLLTNKKYKGLVLSLIKKEA